MTVRVEIARIVRTLFEQDTSAIEDLPDEILEKANDTLLSLIDISSDIENIFSENGSVYIDKVSSALSVLGEIGVDATLVLPKSKNLIFALEFANALTSEQLDTQMSPLHVDFIIYKVTSINGLYFTDGKPLSSFAYYNAKSLGESLQYLDFSAVNTELTDDEFDHSRELNAIIVSAICRVDEALSGHRWVMSSNQNEEKRLALLRYHALLSGYLLTAPVMSPSYSGTENIAETVQRSGRYEQFIEPFEMLSEINSRSTVLDAFLSTYHSLENYMIRAKIVEVERAHQSQTLFGVRQFRSIYSAVDKTEQDNFRNLFKICKSLIIGGLSLENYVIGQVNALIALLGPQGLAEPNLLNFFNALMIASPSGLSEPQCRINLIANLIYKIRCSIVHNKESEYHLSNRELSNTTILNTITILCIPVMRRIAYGLPAVTHGNPIEYSRKEISLY
ncbi:hypothetical protein [Gluconobacter sp. P5B12]|uniref:hypothetical protein n=1 Tax=unclassified Gluconobacter TaxID=2644261 RepID=UPI001C053846|nr:hypothetical protein [Gluconobacter sp. P5B12]